MSFPIDGIRTVEAPRPEELEALGTEELRDAFLLSGLMESGRLKLALTGLDRLAAGGCVPGPKPVRLPPVPQFGTRYFTERREIGIINIGDPGIVSVNGTAYELARLDCLYIGMGEEQILFENLGNGQAEFYFLSCPAHTKYPTVQASAETARADEIGSAARASRRRVVRYIHPEGIESCQLLMGYTELCGGNVWASMPPHTHRGHSEIDFYFDLGDQVVVHLLGQPNRTRHLIVRDREAVLVPGWSINSCVGTEPYRVIWGMAGENREYEDMDIVPVRDLY
ncbi:MAG TPA: 5-dehydro-4-deoxy-D-glucuronate isomerase [Bryobacteraceae bacterium]|nr:5-dehydro-4-deoxy-D-glucuronate isomerase [Bryobacteraceae bacterium]HPU72937.1 5-dehydro-4-deoxy-D-glucuronate isomerase [Bryobacteraceae bacterium]